MRWIVIVIVNNLNLIYIGRLDHFIKCTINTCAYNKCRHKFIYYFTLENVLVLFFLVLWNVKKGPSSISFPIHYSNISHMKLSWLQYGSETLKKITFLKLTLGPSKFQERKIGLSTFENNTKSKLQSTKKKLLLPKQLKPVQN